MEHTNFPRQAKAQQRLFSSSSTVLELKPKHYPGFLIFPK